MIKGLCGFIKHPIATIKLSKKEFFNVYSPTGFLDREQYKFKKLYKAIAFYNVYSKKFDKKILLNAEYVTHWLDVDMKKGANDDLLNIAEGLIKKYASAKLVITSRIHAGLPCLGMDTPVVFISNEQIVAENGNFNTPGRLGGLLELFRSYNLVDGKFISDDLVLKDIKKFKSDFVFNNKDDWKPFATELDKKCTDFMND